MRERVSRVLAIPQQSRSPWYQRLFYTVFPLAEQASRNEALSVTHDQALRLLTNMRVSLLMKFITRQPDLTLVSRQAPITAVA